MGLLHCTEVQKAESSHREARGRRGAPDSEYIAARECAAIHVVGSLTQVSTGQQQMRDVRNLLALVLIRALVHATTILSVIQQSQQERSIIHQVSQDFCLPSWFEPRADSPTTVDGPIDEDVFSYFDKSKDTLAPMKATSRAQSPPLQNHRV